MLIMLSRVFDGVSDVFAGNIIDKTHHRLGKARSWMLWTIIPVALVQILMFSIPNTDQIFQYAYFFVTYTLLNAVFYTLNNVAYTKQTGTCAAWRIPFYFYMSGRLTGFQCNNEYG